MFHLNVNIKKYQDESQIEAPPQTEHSFAPTWLWMTFTINIYIYLEYLDLPLSFTLNIYW